MDAAGTTKLSPPEAWEMLRHGSGRQRFETLGRLWRQARQRNARLQLWVGETLVQERPLGEERLRIGRDPVCELRLEASGVSRVHAFIEKDRPADRDWLLEDFNSANGLYWNDRRIRSIHLRHGDAVQLGSPLREAPTLRYLHPRSVWEQLIHGIGLVSLIGSGVLVSGLLLMSSVSGGSRVDYFGGPVKIVDGNGRRIDAQEGASVAMPHLEDYPLALRQALIASEDSHFGWNSGLDIGGTLRALVKFNSGASGITQQVARIYYPWVKKGNPESPWPWVRIAEDDEKYSKVATVARKLRELPVSWQLETRYNKNEILKMYLDRAYLGSGASGFERGARLYFRKSVKQLTTPEAAYLVGLLPNPEGYSVCAPTPGELYERRLQRQRATGKIEDPDPGESVEGNTPLIRRNLVLRRMLDEGYLSDRQYQDFRDSPLQTDPTACKDEAGWQSYPHFSEYAISEISGRRYSLNVEQDKDGGNLYVVATIDPVLQQLAEDTLGDFLEAEAKPLAIGQAALISIDVSTGRILSYVGGSAPGWDRVQAMRQSGSTFKLFTYLAALEQGVMPSDPISCAIIEPLHQGCRRGGASMSVSDGFAYSENPVAIRLANQAGHDNVIKMARRLGISSIGLEPGANMVLGGDSVLLYEMARAFAVIANQGRSVPMHGVERIYNLRICRSELALEKCKKDGIYEPFPVEAKQLVSPAIAAEMDAMMRRVVTEGTGRSAGVVDDARGKTGTTNDGRDVWFIGYSPSRGIVTGIWMGNDRNEEAPSATGALAAKLWGQFMSKV